MKNDSEKRGQSPGKPTRAGARRQWRVRLSSFLMAGAVAMGCLFLPQGAVAADSPSSSSPGSRAASQARSSTASAASTVANASSAASSAKPTSSKPNASVASKRPESAKTASSATSSVAKAPAKTGAAPSNQAPAMPPSAALDAPAHRKYVTPNNDGTYKLSLDVTGDSAASEEHTPVDVVLVADISGSMAWYVGNTGKKRIEILKQAAQKFAETFLTAENAKLPAAEQTRMSLVLFSSSASLTQGWTTSASAIWGNIPITVSGGTNWEDAFRVANAQQARSGVQKCIVFLSDGEPTFRMSDSFITYPKMGVMGSYQSSKEITLVTAKRGGWFDDAGNKYDVSQISYGDGLGNGRSDPFGLNFAYAAAEANRRGSNTPLFAVSTGSEAEASMSNFSTRTASKHYSGTDPASLAEAFAEIHANITRQHTYTKVSVRDTLSQYVDLMNTVNNNGQVQNVEITAKDASGNPIDTTGLTKTVTYNKQTKELSWNLGDSYRLVKDATYTLSVTVRPSQKAFDEFAQSGYPHTGEADTGDSSAGKQGFFSNDSAGLTYSIVTTSSTGDPVVSAPATVAYAKPVVQVKLNTVHVKKVWANPDYILGYEPPATYPPVTVNVYQDSNRETPYKTFTLSEANGWKADVQLPAGPTGHRYIFYELLAEGYSYSVDPGNVYLTNDITGTKTSNITFTNTPRYSFLYLQKVGEDGDDPDTDPDPLPGAQFKLYKDNNGTRGAEIPNAFGAEDADARFTIERLAEGAYWLEEVKAPNGYQLLPSPIRFTQDEHNGVSLTSAPGNVALVEWRLPEWEVPRLVIQVKDVKKFVMPATGGAGIWPFVAGAGVLIAAGAVVFVYSRRKKS